MSPFWIETQGEQDRRGWVGRGYNILTFGKKFKKGGNPVESRMGMGGHSI
jgi:hypothetical protein